MFLTSLLFVGCSKESTSNNQQLVKTKDELSVASKISTKDYEHVISFDNIDAGIKDGLTDVFIEDNLYKKVEYIGSLGYDVVQTSDRYRIVNENDSSEYFEIYNVSKLVIKLFLM